MGYSEKSGKKFLVLLPKQKQKVTAEIKMLLHASRDCLRNLGINTTITRFDCRDGYYGEAFGMMRTLQVLGYGYLGPVNLDGVQDKGCLEPEHNLNWWMAQLADKVLEEEEFASGIHTCEHCMERYGKDSTIYFGAESETKYLLGIIGIAKSEFEITEQQFIEAERNAGLAPDDSIGPTTGGFTSGAVHATIKLVWRKEGHTF